MTWIQIRFQTTQTLVEKLENVALEAGALSISFEDSQDQPIFEPPIGETPLWEQLNVSVLFAANTQVDNTLNLMQQLFGDDLPQHKVEILEDKDWEREWIKNYQPMQFGQRLWIVPSWTPPPKPDAVNLLLDPGLAFGTGTHPTTALCLQWLDGVDLTGKSLIDFGCGSGILAIAALLLGADKVYAIDIDPQALTATRDNSERNHIDPDTLITYLPEQVPKGLCADIVLANILAGPLIDLSSQLISHCKDKGDLVLSGLLAEQAELVSSHYQAHIQLDAICQEDDWIRISGKKRTTARM